LDFGRILFCHIADVKEIEENEFNLNVSRYVDISEREEEIEIQDAINELIQKCIGMYFTVK
jgi:type I restriction-modification system DNA methylase subunit